MSASNYNIDPRNPQGMGEPIAGVPATMSGVFPPPGAESSLALPPALQVMPDVFSLLKALRRRWFLAGILGLLAAAATGAGAWLLLPKAKYRTEAMLSISKEPPRLMFQTAEKPVDFDTFKLDQRAYLKSKVVLNSALRNLTNSNLPLLRSQEDPILWLEEKLEVNFTGQIMTVGLTGDEPKDLAEIVNKVVQAYLDEIVDLDQKERRRRHEELKTILQNYQARLNDLRKQLEAFAENLGTADGGTARLQHQESIATLAEAQRQLSFITNQLRLAEVELQVRQGQSEPAATQNATGSTTALSAVDEMIRQDPEVRRLTEELAEYKGRIADLNRLSRTPRSDPVARKLYEAAQQIDAALRARVATVRPEVEARLRAGGTVVAGGDPEVNELGRTVKIYKELERLTREDVERLSETTQGLGKNTWSLEEVKDKIEGIDKVASALTSEVEKLDIELLVDPRVRSIERATDPRRQKDKRALMAGVAGLGSFGLVLAGIALIEFRSRRVASVDDVTLGLGLRLVGALPAWPRGANQHGKNGQELAPMRNVLHESVDAMRTVLLRMAVNENLKAVMVTSAVEGEGKTSLACHLSSSLARAGRRTVLVDGDLRKPVLHRLFDLPRNPGLTELLRGEVELDDALQPGPVEGLSVITAGDSNAIAVEALALPVMEDLIAVLKQRFDFVVVDTAPVLPVADTLLIGQHVDGTIFSILSDVSRIPKVHAAHERLKLVGIRNLGTVMTGVHNDVYASAYYYSSSYTTPLGG